MSEKPPSESAIDDALAEGGKLRLAIKAARKRAVTKTAEAVVELEHRIEKNAPFPTHD